MDMFDEEGEDQMDSGKSQSDASVSSSDDELDLQSYMNEKKAKKMA